MTESAREDRAFALALAVTSGLGAALRFHPRGPLPIVLLGIALGAAGIAGLWPPGIRPFRRIVARVGNWIGFFTQPLVLGLFYFIIIVPAALILRRGRRLKIRDDLPTAGGRSYWIQSPPKARSFDDFKRQY